MYKMVIFFMFCSTKAFGQFKLDEKYATGTTIGVFTLPFYYGLYNGIDGSIQQNHHTFHLGIGTKLLPDPEFIHKNWGLNFNYNYFPNGHSNRFDLFFEYNMIVALKYDEYIYKNETNHSLEFIQGHSIGYGFNINFSQHIFLKSALDIGVATYRLAYNDAQIGFSLRLNLGYRF